MMMNKKKAARHRGDAGHRFSVARVPALLATALGALDVHFLQYPVFHHRHA